MKKILSIFIILSALSFSISAQESSKETNQLFNNSSVQNEYAEPDLQHFARSILEVTMMHISLNFYNRVIDQQPYGNITPQTMWSNLTTPWVWDNDEFYINQLYHPYQGSMYFVAGRANGLNFWQSMIPTMYGVLTWEYLMETEIQSLNDLIITPMSGIYVGEILHRTYQEVEDVFLPLAIVISPFDALTRFASGQKSPRVNGSISNFDAFGGYSFVLANQYMESNPDYNISDYPNNNYPDVRKYNKSSNLYFGFNYGYGNQYGHTTREPMDSFDLNFAMIVKPGYFMYSIISDGLILSKSLNTDCDSTLGLTYNYDYLMASDLNYNNNSLGLTLAQRYYFNEEQTRTLKYKTCVSFAVDGCSEYYYLHSIYKRASDEGIEQRLYDIGFGPNFKFDINFVDPVFGKFYANGFASWYYTPSFTKPWEGSTGSNLVLMSQFGYEHKVYDNFSLGINELLYYKHGFYDSVDDITHKMAHTNIYVKYDIK